MEVVYLNSNNGQALAGLGCKEKCVIHSGELDLLSSFLDRHQGSWIFLALSYDLKNEFYPLTSDNPDSVDFPLAIAVAPETTVAIKDGEIQCLEGRMSPEQNKFLNDFLTSKTTTQIPELKPRIDREAYLHTVTQLKEELQFGNIYEINFCQEFLAQEVVIDDEIGLYRQLNELTQTPFSAYVRLDEFSIFCGSPERFLKKKGDQVISQPIKGTIRRGSSEQEDLNNKDLLFNDPKERSENVMIVDLVRNDLSQIATKGSVQVDELFGIYSFKTVHQMISTVSCTVRPQLSFIDLLRATFPMGSMTGAPKRKAMELIEAHESFKRGLYSGSIGYISPNGDFDLNVVIRSLIYNRKKKTLSCSVGSAITIDAIPEKEYDECQVKIHSFLQALAQGS